MTTHRRSSPDISALLVVLHAGSRLDSGNSMTARIAMRQAADEIERIAALEKLHFEETKRSNALEDEVRRLRTDLAQAAPQSIEAEAGDGTWQELIELATRARARARHHFLNSKTHDLFIECAQQLEALAPTTASPLPSGSQAAGEAVTPGAIERMVTGAMETSRLEAIEECAAIALAIDSGRGNEKEIAKAIRRLSPVTSTDQWDAHHNRAYEPVETRAKEIYDFFEFKEVGTKPAWVPGGNSLMQDEARICARKQLRDAGHAPHSSKHGASE